jgi:hypothetical protein
MIRRWLDRLAVRLADTAWLRQMRYREVTSRRAVQHMDRAARDRGNPIADAAFPPRRKGDGPCAPC